MLVLATDYSGLAPYVYAAVGFFSLLNAALFLAYFSFARPRDLQRRPSPWLHLAALAFTIIGPIGFLEGHRLCGVAFNGGTAIDSLVMSGVPAFVGSLLVMFLLKQEFRSGVAWLAPVWGIVPTLSLVIFLPNVSKSGTSDIASFFLWPIPWHLTCLVTFMTAGRRAWKAELQGNSACPACGYDRTGLPQAAPCPECGKGEGREQVSR